MSPTEAKIRGFTLIELLVSMITVLTLGAAMARFFLMESHSYAQQEQSISLEQNLRLASEMLTDAIRNARYGAPPASQLSSWVSWASVNGNPAIAYSSGTTVSSLSLTACFEEPVAVLTAQASVTPVLSAAPLAPYTALSEALDMTPNSKSLIRLGENGEFAQITAVAGSNIIIDTDPTTSGVQGVTRPSTNAYPIGTKICRVDVITFTVGNDPSTGVPRLLRNDNMGSGPQPAAEGIESLQISLTAPRQYTITLHGRSETKEPLRGDYVRRDLSTTVAMRN